MSELSVVFEFPLRPLQPCIINRILTFKFLSNWAFQFGAAVTVLCSPKFLFAVLACPVREATIATVADMIRGHEFGYRFEMTRDLFGFQELQCKFAEQILPEF